MSDSVLTRSKSALDSIEIEALTALELHLAAAIALRHRIHSEPRLGGDEHSTRQIIRGSLGLSDTAVAEGMFVRIGPADGPAVAIRAELDGLPIQETSDVAWRSTRPGIAHLCGHDVHTAALVATTLALSKFDLPVPFIAAFQPREEVMPSGATDFVRDEAFLGQGIQAMIGVHLQPVIPNGSVSALGGAVNASADDFEIIVTGTPSHGAYPHLANDPIVAAAAVIQAIQQLVSRRVNPMNPAVITIGRVSGGDSNNQIPSRVTLLGTARSFSETDRAFLHQAIRDLVRGVVEGYGCRGEVEVKMGEPVLENNVELARRIADVLEADGTIQAPPFRSCGADDFAFYSQHFPSVMIFAGVGDALPGSPGLHHPSFVPSDEAVGAVARIMTLSYFAAARDLLPV